MNGLEPSTEAEVVARLARGDKQYNIAQDLGISERLVGTVKRRQSDALEVINRKLLQRKMRATTRILEKVHQQLEKRIDESAEYWELIDQYQAEYDESEQTETDKELLSVKLKSLKRLTTSELITVAKEMFHESQVEQGKPTSLSYTADANTTKIQLDQIMQAINNGDEIKLLEVTNDNSPHSEN
jgi:DNA-binding CsgD family transcriptional regulator